MFLKRTLFCLSLWLCISFSTSQQHRVPRSRCKVKDIRVQESVKPVEFTGIWYDIARTKVKDESFTLTSTVGKYQQLPSGGWNIEYGGDVDGRCISPLTVTAEPAGPGKFTSSIKGHPHGFLRGDFWVIETNYDYALIYGCYDQQRDGTCKAKQELVYILSRRPTMEHRVLERAYLIMNRRLCVNPKDLQLIDFDVVCPPDTRYHFIGPKPPTGKIPSEVVKPTTTTTTRRPVVEPEEEWSPDHRPPICDRLYCRLECPRGLQQDAAGCDVCECYECPDVRCSLRCRYGFARNQRGCGICQCAQSPGSRLEIVGPEPAHWKCVFDRIRTHRGFKQSEFLGKWYTLATFTSSGITVDSANFILTSKRDRSLATAFSGARHRKCLGTYRGTIRLSGKDPAELYAQYGYAKGPLKIVYMNSDYTYGVTYQCTSNRTDGTCGGVSVDMIGRTTDFPEAVREELQDQTRGLCVNKAKFMLVPHELDCPAAVKKAKYCVVEKFRVELYMDWQRFSGTWYAVSRLKDSGQTPLTMTVQPRQDGTFTITFIDIQAGRQSNVNIYNNCYSVLTDHSYDPTFPYRDDRCGQPWRGTLEPKQDSSGRHKISDGITTVNGSITYTDYTDVAMYYRCTRVQANGVCYPDSTHVVVYKRDRNDPDYSLKASLKQMCISEDRMEVLQNTVECKDEVKCKIEDIPVHQDFNMTRFAGKWHSLSALKTKKFVDHTTIHITDDGDGGATMEYKTYSDGKCSRSTSVRLSPKQNGNSADMTAVGHFKVLYTDYDYAVVYQCDKELLNGACLNGTQYAQILSRLDKRPGDLPDHLRKKFEGFLLGACLIPGDMTPSQFYGECPIDGVCQVKLNDLPSVSHLQTYMLIGDWFRVGVDKKAAAHSNSARLRFSQVGNDRMAMAIAQSRNNKCSPSVQFLASPSFDYKHVWTMHRGRFSVYTKFLYFDGSNVMMYSCNELTKDGACVAGHAQVSLISRYTSVTDQVVNKFMEVALKACFSVEDIKYESQEVPCPVDTEPNICRIDNMPVVEGEDVDLLVGEWYSVLSTLDRKRNYNSMRVYFAPERNNSVHFIYEGARNQQCFPALDRMLIPLSKPNKADYTFLADSVIGRLRVVHADYDSAIIYECGYQTESGFCLGGQVSIDILSRRKFLYPDVKEKLQSQVREICIDPDTLSNVDHRIQCESLAVETKRCGLDSLRIAHNFNRNLLLGTWYVVAGLTRAGSLDSAVYLYSDTAAGYTRLSTAARGRSCQKTVLSQVTPLRDGKLGQYNVTKDSEHGKLIVLYADANYAMILECYEENEDGTCKPDKTVVEVLSRNTSLPEHIRQRMILIGRRSCIESDDLVATRQDVVCPIRKKGLVKCPFSSLPTPDPEAIDVEKISGTWYMQARLPTKEDYESGVMQMKFSKNAREVTVKYRASLYGRCLPLIISNYYKEGSADGKWSYGVASIKGKARIVYADDNYLMLYECDALSEDGTCPEKHQFVDVYGRSTQRLPENHWLKLNAIMFEMCLEPRDFVFTSHLVRCGIEDEEDKELTTCKMEDLTTHKKLDMRLFAGTWYAVARLGKGGVADSSSFRISSLAPYTYDIALTGSRKGKCLPETTGLLYPVRGNSADWIVVFGQNRGQLTILYTDYETTLVSECLGQRSRGRGVCNPKHAEIVVYSRSKRALSGIIEKVLTSATEKPCFTYRSFELIPHLDDCTVQKDGSDVISFADVPADTDLVMLELLGKWYHLFNLRQSREDQYRILHYRLKESGQLLAFSSPGANPGNDVCDGMKLSTYWEDEDDASVWTSGEIVKKVMYVDSDFAIVYTCLQLKENSTCALADVAVSILGRSISTQNLLLNFTAVLGKTGFELGDFTMITHKAPCDLPIKTKQYCRISDMPVATDFSANKFSGVWYSYAKQKGTAALDSGVAIITEGHANMLVAMFLGSRNGQCAPFLNALLTPSTDTNIGEFKYNSVSGQARVRVLYTDYSYTLILECLKETADGRCNPEYSTVVAYSRSKDVPTSAMRKLFDLASDACLYTEDFSLTKHSVNCEVPYSGRRSCRVDDMLVYGRFRKSELLGTWELLVRSTPNSYLSSSTVIFEQDVGQNLKYTVGGTTRDGQCYIARDVVKPVRGERATFEFTIRGVKSLTKLLFMNSQYMMTYDCNNATITDEGTCPKGQEEVEIWGRTDVIDSTVQSLLVDIVSQKTCVDLMNMVEIPNNECRIPKSCNLDQFITQSNFDPRSLSGEWYLLMRTTLDISKHRGVSTKFAQVNGGYISFGAATQSEDDECVTLEGLISEVRGPNLTHAAEIDGKRSLMKFLFVSATHFIRFGCSGGTVDGLCPDNRMELGIFGRSPNIDDQSKKNLIHTAKERTIGCVDLTTLISVPANDDECQVGDIKGRSCLIKDVPAQDTFNMNKVSGTWYLVATTEELPERDAGPTHLDDFEQRNGTTITKFTGLTSYYDDKCPPVYHVNSHDSREIPFSPDYIFHNQTGREGSVVKIIYADESHMVMYKCLNNDVTDYGACENGAEVVEVFSRGEEKYNDVRSKFSSLIEEKTCLNPNTLSMIRYGRCPVPSHCMLDGFDTQENFDSRALSGEWYQLLSASAHAWSYVGVRTKWAQLPGGNVSWGMAASVSGGGCIDKTAVKIPVDTNSATFTHTEGNTTAVDKIIFVNDSYAVLFSCSSAPENGICPEDDMALSIFSRSMEMDSGRQKALIDIANERIRGCVDLTMMIIMPPNTHCPMSHVEGKSCLVEDVPVSVHLNPIKIIGSWYRVGQTRLPQANSGTGSFDFVVEDDGNNIEFTALTSYFGSACPPMYRVTTTHWNQQLSPIHYVYENVTNIDEGIAKIIHMDDKYLVVYKCVDKAVTPYGACDKDKESVDIYTRRDNFNTPLGDDIEKIIAKKTCLKFSELLIPNYLGCSLSGKIQWNNFETVRDFDPRILSGAWTMVIRNNLDAFDTHSVTMNFAQRRGGYITWGLGFKSREGQCSTRSGVYSASLEEDQENTYITNLQGIRMYTKFLYADASSAILVSCKFGLDVNGTCAEDWLHIYFLSRADKFDIWSQRALVETANQRTQGRIDLTSLIKLSEDSECPAAEIHGKSCLVDDVQMVPNLDLQKLSGTWYLVSRRLTPVAWDAGVSHITVRDNVTAVMQSAFLSSDSTGQCSPIVRGTSYATNNDPADLQVFYDDREKYGTSTTKVLHADEKHLIIYRCFRSSMTSYGACAKDKEFIDIMGRRRDVNSVIRGHLLAVVEHATCAEATEFARADHTVKCEIPGVTKGVDYTDKTCHVSSYKTQADFDPQKFKGVWYEIERTRYSFGNFWESGVAYYKTGKKNAFDFTYTGTKEGQCQGPYRATLVMPEESPSNMTMWVGSDAIRGSPWSMRLTYKVIYTDYRNAIIYSCYRTTDDGKCRRSSEQVDVISRYEELETVTKEKLYDIISKELCVDVSELVEPADEDDCLKFIGLTAPPPPPPLSTTTLAPKCHPLVCLMECELGFQKDDSDCDICACVEAAIQPEDLPVGLPVGSGESEEEAKAQDLLVTEKEEETEAEISGEVPDIQPDGPSLEADNSSSIESTKAPEIEQPILKPSDNVTKKNDDVVTKKAAESESGEKKPDDYISKPSNDVTKKDVVTKNAVENDVTQKERYNGVTEVEKGNEATKGLPVSGAIQTELEPPKNLTSWIDKIKRWF